MLDRPTLDGVLLPVITEVEASVLVAPFSEEEIKRAVVGSDGTKSPEPDDFNFSFYKIFWELLERGSWYHVPSILSLVYPSPLLSLVFHYPYS